MDKWIIREYTKEDIPGILNLRRIVFGDEDKDKQKKEFWDWEFKDNYAGNAKIYVADDNGTIVGHYAVIPNMFKNEKNEYLMGSIVVDVMTHPDYRFQGMFTKLGLYSLDCAGKEGIAFSVGYTIRKEVMPGHLKIGWKHVTNMPVLVVPINFENVSKKILNFPPLNKLSNILAKPVYNLFFNRIRKYNQSNNIMVRKIDSFGEDFNNLWEQLEAQYSIIQKRDSNFLNWRFLSNRFREYHIFVAEISERIIGFIVLREMDIFGLKCMVIVDIHVLDFNKKVIDILLNKSYDVALQQNVDLIGCMITTNNYYFKRMKEAGFLVSPYKFGFITHINNECIKDEELNAPDKLFLTWADTDVV